VPKWAIAWIQSFLKMVYRKGQKRGQVHPTLGKESVGTQQRWGKYEKI
jgi:hypothetical protein